MPFNSQLTGPTKDPWWNFGFKYGRTGASRGTTTSSGVLVVPTGLPRGVVYAEAQDEANHQSLVNTGGGPVKTDSTFFVFQFITTDSTLPPPTSARFRVRKLHAASSASTL